MENLNIENFKCFHKVQIPLNGLTVFAGANGNGKSTAIQALLYLRRTVEHCATWEKNRYSLSKPNGLNVELNGSYCLALGNSAYVLPRNFQKNTTTLGLKVSVGMDFAVEYEVPEQQLWLKPINVINEGNQESALFFQEFYYLNAERIGPRVSQGVQFYDFPSAGFQGEFVAQLIADTESNYASKIEEKRKHNGTKSPRLEQQVNAWMDEIMPGVKIAATYDKGTQLAQIRVENYFTKGDPTIATNIGFGISYVLPIIVTGLIAKQGSFMIVENPEAHLHPSAQSKIGRFLAMVANAGVKVIVETHSDHVINGIQLSAALKEIPADQISINFFSQGEADAIQPKIETLSMNGLGELSGWPNGFFDQSQRDYVELFNLRRG